MKNYENKNVVVAMVEKKNGEGSYISLRWKGHFVGTFHEDDFVIALEAMEAFYKSNKKALDDARKEEDESNEVNGAEYAEFLAWKKANEKKGEKKKK